MGETSLAGGTGGREEWAFVLTGLNTPATPPLRLPWILRTQIVLQLSAPSVTAAHPSPPPFRILRMEILLEPFDDIVPRAAAPPPRAEAEANRRVKKKEKKNLSLLSFGEEAQEEEGAQQVGDDTFWGEGLKNEAEG
eukprot:scaffold2004_cov107-Isochrysis_galbana.AAC.1